MFLYPADTPVQFEFDKIKQLLTGYCRSKGARERAASLLPISDKEQLERELLQTNEYVSLLRSGNYFPSTNFPEIDKEVELLRIGNAVLTEQQFLNIKEVSETCNSVIRYFEEKQNTLPKLSTLLYKVYYTSEIVNAIDKIVDPTGEVRSSASTNLSRIRRELSAKRRELEKLFMMQVQKYRKLGYIADTEETVYNGHRVLAILAEHKKSVKGIIVGSSDSGKTTFIEPIETLEISNEVFELEEEETREVYIILRNLSTEIRRFSPLISDYLRLLVSLDFIRSKSLFCNDLNASLPQLSSKPVIHLEKAYHPLLYLQNKKSGKTTIPLHLKLDQEKHILVISGPNSGGKSIALKTVGLFQLMLQSGLLIPAADHSEMYFFDFLLTDIGDSQSIENELSTYSSRLIKMKKILELTDRKTLCLIDEFGTGSDPELGGAVAEVLLEELTHRKSFGLITTHYMNIKLAADKLPGVLNGCMLFDENTLQPLYSLSVGQPGSSYTFMVAEKIGLPQQIIKRAEKKVKNESLHMDKMLARLQKEQSQLSRLVDELEDKRKKAEESRQKHESLSVKYSELLEKKKLTKDDDQHLMDLGRRLKVLINEYEHSKDKKAVIKKFAKAAEQEKARKIEHKKKKENTGLSEVEIAKNISKIRLGAKVKLYKGNEIGVVEEIKKSKAVVIFGAVRTIVELKRLVPA